ncbi:MAG: NAD(P)-dependent alcohol dehydrogenase [Polyangia bacterium]
MKTRAYAASSPTSDLRRHGIERRAVGARDVRIDIAFCGVCHSDLHTARDEWHGTQYPCVPGHEIVGHVAEIGASVTRFALGDAVGVGCMVGACGTCSSCEVGLEQYCITGFTGTYNAPDPHGGITYGGYSEAIVVDEHFVLRIPKALDLAACAPLLCAGITTWSPLKHWKAGPGKKVGIVGLGGLGHMGLKLARALGAHVVQFTTSANKGEDALRLGAHQVVLSTDAAQMAKHASSFDLIIDAVSADHDLNAYLQLVKLDGTLTLVGAPEKPLAIEAFKMLLPRRNFAGSAIGGIAETQEMLDFCGEHGIVSDIERIDIQRINEAYERMLKSDVRYRFVIDMKSLEREVA